MLRRTFLMLTTSLAMACTASQANAVCSPDYSGVTLTVASQTGPYIASALKLGADEWTKKTCGKVNVVEFPWSELYPKIVTSLTGSDATFDLVSFAPAWLSALSTLAQHCRASSVKSSGTVPSSRRPGVPETKICVPPPPDMAMASAYLPM